jgi:hypothetical protein
LALCEIYDGYCQSLPMLLLLRIEFRVLSRWLLVLLTQVMNDVLDVVMDARGMRGAGLEQMPRSMKEDVGKE